MPELLKLEKKHLIDVNVVYGHSNVSFQFQQLKKKIIKITVVASP